MSFYALIGRLACAGVESARDRAIQAAASNYANAAPLTPALMPPTRLG